MKPFTMIFAACAMATVACGSAATMPEPNDPSTKIAAADAPVPSTVVDPEAAALYAPKGGNDDLAIATKTASK